MRSGRYRGRTWLRGHLPSTLASAVRKGRDDCGRHEWYRADAETWHCYHCEPGIASASPWTREEELQHTLAGIDSTLRLLRNGHGDERELLELRRLATEALVALPEEEQRLEQLASAGPAELPDLAQALHAR
ncbi:MAG: hypothetical protein ACYCU0_11000 [Solirubrobacteraceae bacterium]